MRKIWMAFAVFAALMQFFGLFSLWTILMPDHAGTFFMCAVWLLGWVGWVVQDFIYERRA